MKSLMNARRGASYEKGWEPLFWIGVRETGCKGVNWTALGFCCDRDKFSGSITENFLDRGVMLPAQCIPYTRDLVDWGHLTMATYSWDVCLNQMILFLKWWLFMLTTVVYWCNLIEFSTILYFLLLSPWIYLTSQKNKDIWPPLLTITSLIFIYIFLFGFLEIITIVFIFIFSPYFIIVRGSIDLIIYFQFPCHLSPR
jgi:hypothetical protein